MEAPYSSEEEKMRLLDLYRYMHGRMHSTSRPLKLIYHVAERETLLAWVCHWLFWIKCTTFHPNTVVLFGINNCIHWVAGSSCCIRCSPPISPRNELPCCTHTQHCSSGFHVPVKAVLVSVLFSFEALVWSIYLPVCRRSQASLSCTPASAPWWPRRAPSQPSQSFWGGSKRRRTGSSSDTHQSIQPLQTPARALEVANQTSKTPRTTASCPSSETLPGPPK